MMSRLLNVSTSAYYKWHKMNPLHQQAIATINDEVAAIYKRSGNTYGSPRVQIELAKKGVTCSKSTVSRVMSRCNLKARAKKRFIATTDSNHDFEVPANKLNRNFQVNEINKVWVSDITYIQVKKEWMYLTIFLDLADRMIVGWTLSSNMTAQDTVVAAFNKAVQNRCISTNSGLLVHSDRGVQYACKEFRDVLALHKCEQSMSRKGNCWDNAVAESFFKTIKTEKLNYHVFNDASTLKSFIFRYIDGWYNTVRIHSYLDGRSPLEHFYLLTQKLAA
jgi:transposase InsO family protein